MDREPGRPPAATFAPDVNADPCPSPHSSQVALDIAHHSNLLALHHKVSPKEVVVGWFSTSAAPAPGDALIHEFYSRECPNPVYVTIDTSLQGESVDVTAHVGRALSLGGSAVAMAFVETPCDVRTADAERLGMDLLTRELVGRLPGEGEALDASVGRLVDLLARGAAYAEAVAAGAAKPDAAAGRALADALAALPQLPPSDLDALVCDAQQDALLVAYLSELVLAQVALSDRLGTAALPIL